MAENVKGITLNQQLVDLYQDEVRNLSLKWDKEIEEFIYTHPKVKDVQVIGVPDKKYGEEAMACIILKDGEDVSEEEMRNYMTSHIARHKVPRYIEFMTNFPMNAAGKVLKYKMREAAVERLKLDK